MINEESNYMKLLISSFNEIITYLKKESKDYNQIDKLIIVSFEHANNIKSIESNNHPVIRELFDCLSKWILNNFNSSKLSTVVSIISLILLKMGHHTEINVNEVKKLFDIENTADIKEDDEDKEENNKELIISENSFISNQFLSAFYALIVTISNKPEIIVKSKNLLKSVANVMCQICLIENIAIYFKKKRLLSVFAKIVKELNSINTNEIKESLQVISSNFLYLFSKIGIKRSKLNSINLTIRCL